MIYNNKYGKKNIFDLFMLCTWKCPFFARLSRSSTLCKWDSMQGILIAGPYLTALSVRECLSVVRTRFDPGMRTRGLRQVQQIRVQLLRRRRRRKSELRNEISILFRAAGFVSFFGHCVKDNLARRFQRS